jgi:thioredoxin 1
MNVLARVLILCLLALVTTAVLIVKTRPEKPAAQQAAVVAEPVIAVAESAALPRLVDLGAGKCVPCKMMEPVLEELRLEYADTFAVEFIDVWENPGAGTNYGIRVIPTQIFYDRDGKELFRHEGFFAKDDILAKWHEFGVSPPDMVQQ